MRKFYVYGIYDKQEPEHLLYVGQHIYSDINDKYMGSGVNLQAYYKMFGKNNFGKVILESNINIENIGDKEKEYIKKYKDIGQAELNILGGSNTSFCSHFLRLENETMEEYIKRMKREYNKKNAEKIKIQNKIRGERWRKLNKEYKKEKDKEYQKNHREERYKTEKKYIENNKEKVTKYASNYYEEHKEELKKYRADMHKITKFLKKCPALWNYYTNLKSNLDKTNFRESLKNIFENKIY